MMVKKLVAGLLPAFALAAAALARPVVLEQGTEVMIKVVDRIKSSQVRKGQVLSFTVDAPVCDAKGFVVIERGAPAYGTVAKVSKAGMFGKRGSLEITIDRAIAFNGRDVPLTSAASDKGDNNTAVVTTAAVLVAVPAIFFRGSNAVIESGTILRAQVAARTMFDDGKPTQQPRRKKQPKRRK